MLRIRNDFFTTSPFRLAKDFIEGEAARGEKRDNFPNQSFKAADVGKIDSPPGGAPSGSWRITGISAEKTKSGEKWKITTTWQSAAPGADWDKDLYG